MMSIDEVTKEIDRVLSAIGAGEAKPAAAKAAKAGEGQGGQGQDG